MSHCCPSLGPEGASAQPVAYDPKYSCLSRDIIIETLAALPPTGRHYFSASIAANMATETTVCTHWIKGKCVYGSTCKYMHQKKDSPVRTSVARVVRPANTQTEKQYPSEEVDFLFKHLPECLNMLSLSERERIHEVVLDLAQPPLVRKVKSDGTDTFREIRTGLTTSEELHMLLDSGVCTHFDHRNRAGVEGTLHRISRMLSTDGTETTSLTVRIGIPVPASSFVDQSILSDGVLKHKKSVLFVSPPGLGKTTAIRQACYLLSKNHDMRVVAVDSSGEIGGFGTLQHRCLGSARRFPVPPDTRRDDIMMQAVENHNAQVVVVDEIRNKEEANIARSIAERGVRLVATAHAADLQSLRKNKHLQGLVGDVQSYLLSAREREDRGMEGKVQTDLARNPTFDCLVEIQSINRWAVHDNVTQAVETLLEGQTPEPRVATLS